MRPLFLLVCLSLGGCGVAVPVLAAAIGFASAEVGVLPALASDYLCYKGHAAECGTLTPTPAVPATQTTP